MAKLPSVRLPSLPHVRRTDKSVCCLFPDTKNTQWEDPRLQSPAITGPVSSFCYMELWFSRPAAYLPPAPASRYDTVESLCRCLFTCQHLFVVVVVVVCMKIPLRMWLALSCSLCSGVTLCNFTFSRFSFLGSFVPAGCSLLQGVQAEIRLLQEEVKEAGEKRLIFSGCRCSFCSGSIDGRGRDVTASILFLA